MPLDEQDSQVIAAMIARAVAAAASGHYSGPTGPAAASEPGNSLNLEPEALEEIARHPELQLLFELFYIWIYTSAGDRPGDPVLQRARILGRSYGGGREIDCSFPPGEPAHLEELLRIQNHQHLLRRASLSFIDTTDGPSIRKISIGRKSKNSGVVPKHEV